MPGLAVSDEAGLGTQTGTHQGQEGGALAQLGHCEARRKSRLQPGGEVGSALARPFAGRSPASGSDLPSLWSPGLHHVVLRFRTEVSHNSLENTVYHLEHCTSKFSQAYFEPIEVVGMLPGEKIDLFLLDV